MAAIKNIIRVLFLIFAAHMLFAVAVDVPEVRSVQKKVKFKNFTGTLRTSDGPGDLARIGGALAEKVKQSSNGRGTVDGKYTIIHAFKAATKTEDSKDKNKRFAADILVIEASALIKHIDALRTILGAYLAEMYGYTADDAETLASFILFYNAVYRSEIKYFEEKYQKMVTANLSAPKTGIAVNYADWPGQTQLLIPLTENAARGKLDAVDPDVISDKKVRSRVRKDDGNIKTREKLLTIKKKVIDNNEEDLTKKKTKLAGEKKTLRDDEARLSKKREDQRKREKEIADEKERAKKIKDPEARRRKENEIRDQEKRLKKDKEQGGDNEQKLADQKKRLARKEDDVKRDEDRLNKRKKNARDDEREIDHDKLKKTIRDDESTGKKKLRQKAENLRTKEKKLDDREDRLRQKQADRHIYDDKLYYLKMIDATDSGHYDNELYIIDAATRKVLVKSPVKNICGRRFDIFSKAVVIITHEGDHGTQHRLTMLDRGTLEIKKQGADEVFWRTFVIIKGDFIYAIMHQKGAYFLAKYDTDLKRAARSQTRINANTFISFFKDYIYVNRWDKKVLVLNQKDLSEKDVIDLKAAMKK